MGAQGWRASEGEGGKSFGYRFRSQVVSCGMPLPPILFIE